MSNSAKQAAGEAGAALVESGMRVGLGTGSTTAFALQALGRRLREGDLEDIVGVPTSPAAEQHARAEGLPLDTLDAPGHLDLALDGADEVGPALELIKGRGAAHTREKIVAAEAVRFVILVDPSKRVAHLGEQAPIPVEVVPLAAGPVLRFLEGWGAQAQLRSGEGKDGPVVTDQGLWVIDARFENSIAESGRAGPEVLADALSRQPGVLDHGLFLESATDVLVGQPDGTVKHLQR